MTSDIVIGIDSSTTATKVIAWDCLGKNIAEASSPVPLISPKSCYYEQNPDDWWLSAVKSPAKVITAGQ